MGAFSLYCFRSSSWAGTRPLRVSQLVTFMCLSFAWSSGCQTRFSIQRTSWQRCLVVERASPPPAVAAAEAVIPVQRLEQRWHKETFSRLELRPQTPVRGQSKRQDVQEIRTRFLNSLLINNTSAITPHKLERRSSKRDLLKEVSF